MLNRNRKVAVQIDDALFDTFHVSFDVIKTVKRSPRNRARISIFNVDAEVYENAVRRSRDLVVQLFAGYGVPGLVFQGNPVKNGVKYRWQDADKVLTIEAEDGYRSYQRSRVSFSLDTDQVTMVDLVAMAATAMGLPAGIIDLGDAPQTLTQGLTVHGAASDLLDRVAAATGADWSIQDGRIQMLPKHKVRRSQGPLYSHKHQNIKQFPEFTDEGIRLTTFLDSSIAPGDRFQIESGDPRYDGIYKAHTIQHSGSLWDGGPWDTEVQGRRWVETVPADPVPPANLDIWKLAELTRPFDPLWPLKPDDS